MRRFLPLLGVLACSDPKPPVACGTLAPMNVFVATWETAEPCFEDPEGGLLTLAATSLNPDIAVALAFDTDVRIQGVSPGVTTVTIRATDPDGLAATQDLEVFVPNRPPVEDPPLDDVRLRLGAEMTIDLAVHFTDPDGQPLTYTASSSASSVVSVELSGTMLTLKAAGLQVGTAEISVTASDGEESVTATFAATVVAPVLLISDDFDSDASLDDWVMSDFASAAIEDGYFVLTTDSTNRYGLANRTLGGQAGDLTVDIVLRTTDEDAQAGFWIFTGHSRYEFYVFALGEEDLGEPGTVNWTFSWYDGIEGHLVNADWSTGESGEIADFTDVDISLSLSEDGVRATVDGKPLFEHGPEPYLLNTFVSFALATRPEGQASGPTSSSMNRVRVTAWEFAGNGRRRTHRPPE